jgi:hypothetical protein
MKYLLLLIIFCCCSSQATYTYTDKSTNPYPAKETIWIYLDPTFDIFDQISISEAVASWDHSLNNYLNLRMALLSQYQDDQPAYVRTNDWIIIKVNAGDKRIPPINPGRVIMGYAEKNHIYLARNIMQVKDVYPISLHEIGHLLGAQHQGKLLMFPNYQPQKFNCIDKQTVKQVAKINHLPFDHLNFCEAN